MHVKREGDPHSNDVKKKTFQKSSMHSSTLSDSDNKFDSHIKENLIKENKINLFPSPLLKKILAFVSCDYGLVEALKLK